MKKSFYLVACLVLLCFTSVANGQDEVKLAGGVVSASSSSTPVKAGSESKYVPVEKYDPLRNADQDIKNALAEARRTNKRVLLEVGGLWCIWCTHMDNFFIKHADVLALREKYFVTLKINHSPENKNEVVLSRYPKIGGFPHIFVLDADGALLHSQDTEILEEGKGYHPDKFTEFLKQWADKSVESAVK